MCVLQTKLVRKERQSGLSAKFWIKTQTNQPTKTQRSYGWEHLYKLVGWKDRNRIQVSESKVSVHCVEPEKVIQMMASGSGSITACEGSTNSVTEAAPHHS